MSCDKVHVYIVPSLAELPNKGMTPIGLMSCWREEGREEGGREGGREGGGREEGRGDKVKWQYRK